MPIKNEQHLRYQDHNGRNRFELEIRKWCKVSMRPINDEIIEEMYQHIQVIHNPMEFSLPGSYFVSVQPIVNPEDDSE